MSTTNLLDKHRGTPCVACPSLSTVVISNICTNCGRLGRDGVCEPHAIEAMQRANWDWPCKECGAVCKMKWSEPVRIPEV